ncbi:hypothetical protein GH141_01510 [bacterium]|nr:hypothetical protein [bacterium]
MNTGLIKLAKSQRKDVALKVGNEIGISLGYEEEGICPVFLGYVSSITVEKNEFVCRIQDMMSILSQVQMPSKVYRRGTTEWRKIISDIWGNPVEFGDSIEGTNEITFDCSHLPAPKALERLTRGDATYTGASGAEVVATFVASVYYVIPGTNTLYFGEPDKVQPYPNGGGIPVLEVGRNLIKYKLKQEGESDYKGVKAIGFDPKHCKPNIRVEVGEDPRKLITCATVNKSELEKKAKAEWKSWEKLSAHTGTATLFGWPRLQPRMEVKFKEEKGGTPISNILPELARLTRVIHKFGWSSGFRTEVEFYGI